MESVTSSTKVASLPRRAPALMRHAEPKLAGEFPVLKANGQGEESEVPARLSVCCVERPNCRQNTFAEEASVASVASVPLLYADREISIAVASVAVDDRENSCHNVEFGPIMNQFLIGRQSTRTQSYLVGLPASEAAIGGASFSCTSTTNILGSSDPATSFFKHGHVGGHDGHRFFKHGGTGEGERAGVGGVGGHEDHRFFSIWIRRHIQISNIQICLQVAVHKHIH